MVRRMLIDATHLEETRVVVVKGNRVEELDFESRRRKALRGNIYLAKVTRVEPSLQAAFVDYGGNRHGFLAFSEIHPDYYKLPVSDREALLAEQAGAGNAGDGNGADRSPADNGTDEDRSDDSSKVETLDDVAESEEVARRRVRLTRRYRIQEVIKRRQILLIQVTKEERGNKGAALTTYISLAGRYCVLMPNTGRGGGISRKITNVSDRKRLKTVLEDLDVTEGMSVILRTAGQSRNKREVKRDYEYLSRLWDDIRELTLQSTAPALIFEEADVVKRAIRDMYSRDIEEVLVEGEDAYKSARAFMKSMIPSHVRHVKRYQDGAVPLFHRYQIESQLDTIYSPTIQMRSGSYIVINSTEALVAIDVNSGRATKERNIEETALRTNLEAAEEITRQLRLRDLAGLIVIDFIDMEDSRNTSAVERSLKESMRNDRARIQIGRISHFGLLEMSRQRLRTGLLETSSERCSACGGSGLVRSADSMALQVLRAIEEEGLRHRNDEITVTVPDSVALYILNQKRRLLGEIENRHGFRVVVESDDEIAPPEFRIDLTGAETTHEQRAADAGGPAEAGLPEEDVEFASDDEPEETDDLIARAADEDEAEKPRKRRRRGRRGGRRRTRRPDESDETEAEETTELDVAAEEPAATAPELEVAAGADQSTAAVVTREDAGDEPTPAKTPPRPRRKRATRSRRTETAAESTDDGTDVDKTSKKTAATKPDSKPRRRRTPKKQDVATPAAEEEADEQQPRTVDLQEALPPLAAAGEASSDEGTESPAELEGNDARPPRRGWWQRLTS